MNMESLLFPEKRIESRPEGVPSRVMILKQDH